MQAAGSSCRKPPPLRLRPAATGLELPVRPLPAARHIALCLALATGLLVVDLLLRRHWVMGLAYAGLAVVLRARGRLLPQGPAAPRRLLLTADGRLLLFLVGGGVVTATPAGQSQWIGNSLLLVLQTPGRRYALLFGHGNLEPAVFATLRRRLRGAQATPSSGVDC